MEKKAWVQPLATVQQFVANEYVAACWGVRCDVPEKGGAAKGSKTNIDDPFPANGVTHRDFYCGDATHYQIRLDANNVPYEMYETQTDKLGDLKCDLYTDDTYTTPKEIKTVKANEYLYWTTKSGNKTWHHHGQVTAAGNSNHS